AFSIISFQLTEFAIVVITNASDTECIFGQGQQRLVYLRQIFVCWSHSREGWAMPLYWLIYRHNNQVSIVIEPARHHSSPGCGPTQNEGSLGPNFSRPR